MVEIGAGWQNRHVAGHFRITYSESGWPVQKSFKFSQSRGIPRTVMTGVVFKSLSTQCMYSAPSVLRSHRPHVLAHATWIL